MSLEIANADIIQLSSIQTDSLFEIFNDEYISRESFNEMMRDISQSIENKQVSELYTQTNGYEKLQESDKQMYIKPIDIATIISHNYLINVHLQDLEKRLESTNCKEFFVFIDRTGFHKHSANIAGMHLLFKSNIKLYANRNLIKFRIDVFLDKNYYEFNKVIGDVCIMVTCIFCSTNKYAEPYFRNTIYLIWSAADLQISVFSYKILERIITEITSNSFYHQNPEAILYFGDITKFLNIKDKDFKFLLHPYMPLFKKNIKYNDCK
jgi:hypothetical protein